jgi:predicted  nucleic acid-binding Zn-ribbon protein
MAGLRSLLRPLNRQLRVHVEEVSLPRLDQLSGQIEDVRQATVDLRRLVTDDLDASNEAAALIGRSLQELQSAVTALQAQLADRS